MANLFKFTSSTQQAGKAGEHEAFQFLQKKGLRLLSQNYRCYYGEIDLIMLDKEDVVFVEVRKRTRVDYGNAFESVNLSKRKRLIKTAIHFLQFKKWLNKINSRFDIVAIHPIQGTMQIEWIKNAFLVENN